MVVSKGSPTGGVGMSKNKLNPNTFYNGSPWGNAETEGVYQDYGVLDHKRGLSLREGGRALHESYILHLRLR